MKIGTIRIIMWLAFSRRGACSLMGVYALIWPAYVYLEPSLPTVAAMGTGSLPVPLRIYTRSGQLIAQIGEKRRIPVAFDDIPVLVREAFVAAEDQRFFTHHGFDYSGVLRAAMVDLTSGDFSQGASTITMQTARNMFLTFDKTIRRKLQEIFLTLPHGARILEGGDSRDLFQCDLSSASARTVSSRRQKPISANRSISSRSLRQRRSPVFRRLRHATTRLSARGLRRRGVATCWGRCRSSITSMLARRSARP